MVCVRYWVVAIGDCLDRELQLFFSSLFALWICVSQRACGASAQPLTDETCRLCLGEAV